MIRPLSLRAKLLWASMFVEAVMLSILVANSLRLTEESLIQQTRQRVEELNILFGSALAAPLAERDYATLNEVLEDGRRDRGIIYLVLKDRTGGIVATAGWDAAKPLPPPSKTIEFKTARSGRIDIAVPIVLVGQTYGILSYGLSTKYLNESRLHLLRQSVLIAVIEIALSFLLLAALGYWLTRHLSLLTRASRAMSEGDFSVTLHATSSDEVGQLTRTFNEMAEHVRRRVAQLSEGEAKFHAIADYTHDWETWSSPQGEIIWMNPSVQRMTGYTREECAALGFFPLKLVVDEDVERVRQAFLNASRGHAGSNFEFRIIRKNGSQFWAAVNWQPIYDSDRRYLGIRSSIRDVSQLKETELVLRDALRDLEQAQSEQRRYLGKAEDEQARLNSLLGAMNLGILFVGLSHEVLYRNPAFLRIWMIAESVPLVGRAATDIFADSATAPVEAEQFAKTLDGLLKRSPVAETYEIPLLDGRVLTQVCYPVKDRDARIIGSLWIFEDITRERYTAEQLIYLAERDSLSGLYNRRRFQEELARVLLEADRAHTHAALLFFDLDEFKYVNDTYGHGAGDAMLVRVAGEVGTLLRRNEIFGRLGGDEFGILVPNAAGSELEGFAERIVRAISQIPFQFDDAHLRLTTSLGIALYPQHATDAEELAAHADSAMYQAKAAGKNTWRFYRQDIDVSQKMVARLSWNERIGNALGQGLLALQFQGIFRTDRSLAHLEVLVRMKDPDRPGHLIMPAQFIPFAEKSGMILDIDRWVLRESMATLAKGAHVPPLAVNISGRSFDDPALPRYIGEQLHRFGIAPQRLLIELTETAAVSDLRDAERFIEELHQLGCRVCLDDFGAGFSSFAYLKHIKADILKIDGMFIRDLPHDPDNIVFVKAMVDVAQGMGKPVVAEFVEDEETFRMLKRFGVEYMQGYYLERPCSDHPALTAEP